MDLDPTMSQDIAFVSETSKDDLFQFDTEVTPQESQPEQSSTEAPSPSAEDDAVVEEQKVPYSRFKRKVDELNEYQTRIQSLEERLEELANVRQESTASSDVDVPPEWTKLYGDSDVSREAWKIQLQREAQLQENAVKIAIKQIQEAQVQEVTQLEENENLIDENIEALQESLGKKFTPKMEEAILSIVDEFSPTGSDGKYTSLFPFDKAYEIFELRQSKQGQATNRARKSVADLTGNSSEGDVDSSEVPFNRNWDNWRDAISN